MKVVLSSEKVMEYINKYYNEVLGIKGYAVFQSDEKYSGYGRLEEKVKIPKIMYYGTTEILGQENNVSIEIHDLDIKDIIDHFLAEEGYSSYNFYIDKGSHREVKDSFPVGRTRIINRPYFNCVELEVTTYTNDKRY